MNIVLSAALILQAVCFVWLVDRVTRRHDTQVSDLCQRLQAPEVAVAQHAHYEDGEEQPMADEDLAEREERARVLAFIAHHENGGEQ